MFEEWRKRIANQPRPLKKRSSFSEAESPGGPNMQRFYYQQLYQKSDPLFRFDPRNVPAEEEEEHSSQSSDSDLRHRDQNDGPAHNIQQENFKKNAKAAITK